MSTDATDQPPPRCRPCVLRLATRAHESVGPTQSHQVLAASLFGREPLFELQDGARVVFHSPEYYILWRYRYYVCSRAQQQGRNGCPSKSIPATQIEEFVMQQVLNQNGSAAAHPLWQSLNTTEQAGLLSQRIQRVNYDGHHRPRERPQLAADKSS